MPVNILYVTDLHKLPKDKTTIRGYVNCFRTVQRNLLSLIEERHIDYLLEGGDWYDKGYVSDIAGALADTDMDMIMSHKLNGNFYGVIGNHIRLNMDSNPELHLIQPHVRYKSRAATERKEQIIKTPDVLRIGNVQISFMHFNVTKTNVLDYHPHREDWATYHIALFHTDMIIPYNMLYKTQMGYMATPTTKIVEALDGVDLALCGHIHNALGQFAVGPNTTMVVPGSLTNTDSSTESRHTVCMLPLITVQDDSTVTVSYIRFDLCTNLLTFIPKTADLLREKLHSIRGNSVDKLYDESSVAQINYDAVTMNINGFIKQQNWTKGDKMMFKTVLTKPDDLKELIKAYKERDILSAERQI